ncbi:class I tRNA ligase family protein [Candidatus Shikimatogenerans bostrichidophilus]|uniref:class I tRNA ligase family protein n=1 Tax=Candidatus Shikimatogenerans bostrichidophilus TaxID=2943807 RepID=UPI002965F54E
MKYNFKLIENKWIKKHKKINFLKYNKKNKKKFYILNMFPYPSGYGLHVGHTVGYIYSDIIAKYKLGKNYNILNPIGFDSFGLPAEQYAINQNEHPIQIINKSIKKFKKQIKRLGVFLNWEREIITHNSNYYKWTQWIFIKLFNSWYDNNKAKNINILIKKIKNKKFYLKKKLIKWNLLDENKKNKILNKFRLIYLKKSYVNWCPKLSTVLSNEEIDNGKSIRGGYDIIKKKMLQWHIRITKYCNRLLKDFKYILWPKNIKNSQIKWIGKKKVNCFYLKNKKIKFKIFCKTKKEIKRIKNIIFVAPSNNTDLLIKNYIKKKTKIKNIIKKIYNNNKNIIILIRTNIYNSNNNKINIYISNYFKNKSLNNVYTSINNKDKFFKLNIYKELSLEKDFNIKNIYIENKNVKKKYIFNLNDIVFSRQRYWGEPIPIYYKNNIPFNINIKNLPLKLPNIKNIKNFKLKNYEKWAWNNKTNKIVSKKLINKNIYQLDVNTMPSFAASNWYYIRYIDPYNNNFIVNSKKIKYWKNVDLYIGGSEHTNGHLLYARFCHKFLKDINLLNTKEPFKQYINQGIILYNSNIIYKKNNKKLFVSYDLIKNKNKYQKIYVIKDYISNKKYLNINKYIENNKLYKNFKFKLNNKNKFICKIKLEKMSKSKLNIVNPDDIINKYGIDCFRLYQVFMGPFKKKKIWKVNNIKGVYRFLNKIWSYINKIINIKNKLIKTTYEENYIINKLILKINNNFKNYNLNTSISSLMISFNKLIKIKCENKKIIKKYIILLSIFAPYISEEIWFLLGNKKSIFFEKQPSLNKKYLIKKKIKYIVMINNKKKIIIYINKLNNNKNYLINKLINNKNLNIKNYKKIIYIKNRIINFLI